MFKEHVCSSEILDHLCHSEIVTDTTNDQLMPWKFYGRGLYADEYDWDDVRDPITEDEDIEEVERGCYPDVPDYDESFLESNYGYASDGCPWITHTKGGQLQLLVSCYKDWHSNQFAREHHKNRGKQDDSKGWNWNSSSSSSHWWSQHGWHL